MLKNILIILILCFSNFWLSGQENINWVLGSYPNDATNGTGGMILNFATENPTITEFDIPIGFDAIACISDEKGVLLFYTNGCEIINKNHEIMESGSDLNNGYLSDLLCDVGYSGQTSVMILPYPGRKDHYAVLSLFQSAAVNPFTMQVSEVDMTLNNGLGGVVRKNESFSDVFGAHILESILTLTAVRHANGRDWYIVFIDGINKIYNPNLIYLFSPDGFKRITLGEKDIGLTTVATEIGQTCFSPDGKLFAQSDNSFLGRVWTFDRCTGQLKEPSIFGYLGYGHDFNHICDIFPKGGGISFSPNSRFMYFSAVDTLFQFDCWSDDPVKSKIVVGVYDGVEDPYPTYFDKHMLAANGKIYISTRYPSKYMHVINHPNEKGLDCDFELRGLVLPRKHYSGPPNMVNYSLLDVPESECDSLGINGVTSIADLPVNMDWNIYPNPTSSEMHIELNSGTSAHWILSDMLGKECMHGTVKRGQIGHFDLDKFPTGVYFIVLYQNNQTSLPKKIVLMRD